MEQDPAHYGRLFDERETTRQKVSSRTTIALVFTVSQSVAAVGCAFAAARWTARSIPRVPKGMTSSGTKS